MSIRLKVCLLAAAALLVTALMALSTAREPKYKDRPLTQWLEMYRWTFIGYAPQESVEQYREEARAAIRQCGVKIIPRLFAMLRREDATTPVGIGIGKFFGLRYLTAQEDRQLAAFGLHALGPDAVSTIPTLVALLEQEPELAALALSGMGTAARSAVPAVERGLTNRNPSVHIELLTALVKMDPNPARLVPLLLAEMTNGYPASAGRACQLLGDLGDQAAAALPELRRLLAEDANPLVRDLAESLLVKLNRHPDGNFTTLCAHYAQPAELAALRAWAVKLMNATPYRRELRVQPGNFPPSLVGYFGWPLPVLCEPGRTDFPRRLTIATGNPGERWGLYLGDPGVVLRHPVAELFPLGDGVWAFREKP